MPENRNDSNSTVMRTALSNVTADGKASFRTSLFGFNKEAVNRYIDNLYYEFSSEETRLNKQIRGLNADKSGLEDKVRYLQDSLQELQSQVAIELDFLNTFHDRETGYRNNISSLSDTISILAKRLKKAGEVNVALNTKLGETTRERDSARSELALANTSVSELQSDKRKLSAEIADLHRQNEEHKQSILEKEEELTGSLETLSSRNASIEDLNRKLLEKDVQIKRSEQELSVARQQNQQLSGAYSVAMKKLQDAELFADSQRKTAQQLRSQADYYSRNATSSASDSARRISALQQELALMERRNGDLQNSLSQKMGQMQEMNARYNEVVAELKKRDAVISDMRGEINTANRKAMDYEFKVNSLNGDIVRLEIAVSQKENETLMLRRQIASMEARINYQNQQLSERSMPEDKGISIAH